MSRTLASLLVLLLVVLSQVDWCTCDSFAIDDEATCEETADTYFDTASYLCVTCPTGEILGDDNICRCPIGKLMDIPDALEPLDFTCENTCAASSLSTSQDSTQCLSCDATTDAVYDATTQDCRCLNPNGVLTERNSAGTFLGQKQCVTCPANSYVDQDVDRYTCIACPDPNMVADGNGGCDCDNSDPNNKWVQAGDVCLQEVLVDEVLSTYSVDTASIVTYRNVRSQDTDSDTNVDVASGTFTDIFLPAAVNCKYFRKREACQALLHLCLMQMYDLDMDVCRLYQEIENGVQTTEHDFREWKTSMPLMMFEDDRFLRDTSIQQTVLFEPLKVTDTDDRSFAADMLFWLAKYTVDGEFLGYEKLDSQLMLCGESPRKSELFLRFATDYINTCEIDLIDLLSTDQYFYELFFVDTDDLVVPVPVKILNYRDQGDLPNVDAKGNEILTQGNLALHRRFYLFDRLSGKASSLDTNPEILSYAAEVTMRIEMQPDSETKIYPPVLSIRYRQRRVASILEGGRQGVSRSDFRMEYFDDDDGLREARTVLFSLAIIAVFLVWMFKMYVYQRTNMLLAFDGAFALRAFVMMGATVAEFFFWLIFILDFYTFCFFKGQQEVFYLLPVEGSDLYGEHRAIMVIAFFGKLFDVILKLTNQIFSDIFFVDWEMPKGGRRQDEGAVSVWRKLMVTNIWNDLQIYRIVDINFTILFMLFFLYGLELANASTKQPNLRDLTDTTAPVNEVLRFALSSLCWLVLAGGQLVFQKFIYQRYMEHKSGQFVDLLNLTNISCFIFDERYRCYYLHGESISKHADVSMEEINDVLKAYMNSATRSHGLESTGIDTWIVYTSRALRRKYDDTYNAVVARKKNESNLQNRRAAMEGGGETGREMKRRDEFNADKKLVTAANALNRFLKDFITRSNPDFPRQIDTRGMVASRFNIPPANRLDNEEVSLFFPDLNFSFTNVTLMGMEYELILFYALFHGVCDLLWSNTFVSLFLVYLVDRAIVMGRRHWGAINLANKTLVDNRFLI